jgi:hypothetical protein
MILSLSGDDGFSTFQIAYSVVKKEGTCRELAWTRTERFLAILYKLDVIPISNAM